MSSLPKEEPMVTNETSESDRRFTDAAVATAELNANCKVLFEGEEEAPLFVNRELLAVYSVVFRAMFYGDFMETNTEMIKLTDVRRVDFLLFLSCLYAPAKPVEAKNLMAIWTLADGFECAVLMKECEQVVEKMRRPSSVEEFKNLIEFCDLRKWHDKMERLFEGANFSTISALLNETWLGSLDEKTRKIVSESVQSAYRPVVASTGVENGSEAVRPSVRLAAEAMYLTEVVEVEAGDEKVVGFLSLMMSEFDEDKCKYRLEARITKEEDNKKYEKWSADIVVGSEYTDDGPDQKLSELPRFLLTNDRPSAKFTPPGIYYYPGGEFEPLEPDYFTLSVLVRNETVRPRKFEDTTIRFTDQAQARELNANCKVFLVDSDEPVYINRELLAVYSKMFRAMFQGNFKEKDAEEVKLEVNRDDFLSFLDCLYYPTVPVTVKNLKPVAMMADRFECLKLLENCKKFAKIGAKTVATGEECMDLIEIAEHFRWNHVIKAVIDAMRNENAKFFIEVLDDEWMMAREESIRYSIFEGIEDILPPTAMKQVKHRPGKPELRSTKMRNLKVNCEILCEDSIEQVHANQELLARHSTVFRKMFEEKEDASEIKLDVKREDFVSFLDCLRKPSMPISAHNFKAVLLMAKYFDCSQLLEKGKKFAEKEASKATTLEDCKDYFEVAEQLRWNDISLIIDSMKDQGVVIFMELLNSEWIEERKENTQKALFDGMKEALGDLDFSNDSDDEKEAMYRTEAVAMYAGEERAFGFLSILLSEVNEVDCEYSVEARITKEEDKKKYEKWSADIVVAAHCACSSDPPLTEMPHVLLTNDRPSVKLSTPECKYPNGGVESCESYGFALSVLVRNETMRPRKFEGTTIRFTDQAQARELNANCKVFLADSDEPVFVNRELLAVYCKTFRAMFESDFMEKNAAKIKLEVYRDDFLSFLDCLYFPPVPLMSRNVKTVAVLADRFDCPQLFEKCKKFVEMQAKRVTTIGDCMDYIELAEAFDWKDVMVSITQVLKSKGGKFFKEILDYEWMMSRQKSTRGALFKVMECVLPWKALNAHRFDETKVPKKKKKMQYVDACAKLKKDCSIRFDELAEPIHTNRKFLARHSNVFRKLFDETKDVDEIKIDMKRADFVSFLNCLRFPTKPLCPEKFMTVLLLAKHYECPELIKKCNEFAEKEAINCKEFIEAAEQLGWDDIPIIEAMKNKGVGIFIELLDSDWIEGRKENTKLTLFDAMKEAISRYV